jgi:cytochrome c oxidase subunit III
LAEQPVVLTEQHAPAVHGPEHRPPGLAHHFDDLVQQREAAELGMWLFLATEFMFFGGLFMAYLLYRYWYPAEFATGSQAMDIVAGTVNTLVLLASSLTMALAVHAAHESQRKQLVWLLLATIALGCVFLGIKAYEYHHKYEQQAIPFAGLPFHYTGTERAGMAAFYNLYFLMTGLHAFHMVIGIVMLSILAVLANRGGLLAERSIIVHNAGLYWHFVDVVWVYLFPFFYLATGHFGSGGGH